MARLLGPNGSDRLVYASVGTALVGAPGATALVYSDAAGTTLADIATYDGTGTPGASIAGSSLTVDSTSQLPLFWFPDGVDTVYVRVNGGPATPVGVSVDARLDALEAGGGGGGVPTSRQVIAGTGLTGGGTLAADRTFTVAYGTTSTTAAVGNDSRITGAVQTTRTISTSTGLTGGGDLSANRTLSVVADSTVQQVEVAKAGTLVGARKRVNLIEGSNVTLTVADNAGSNRVDVTVASTGGGGSTGTPLVYYVAATDSTTGEKAKANATCDGTADNVEIQAAIDAMKGVGVVVLAAGTYQLAAVVNLYGDNDVNIEHDHYLQGAGPSGTVLVAASGLASGLNISRCAKVHISNLRITVTGATHGIAAAYSGVTASLYRSFWLSSFKNIQVIGPWDGTHSGYAFHLGSFFRSTFENLEAGGVGNGIRLYSENAAFNPGDSVFTRAFMDLSGNTKRAYSFESTVSGSLLNQVEMVMCEAIASGTGCTGYYFGGTDQVVSIKVRGANLEQFDTCAHFNNADGCVIDGNYWELRTGAAANTTQLVRFEAGAVNNYVQRVSYWYTANSVRMVLSTATDATQPNVVERVKMLDDTGATVTNSISTAGAVITRDIVTSGAGTATTVAKSPSAVVPANVVTLTDAATITLDASLGNLFRVTLGGNRTLANPTNPIDGQRIIVEAIQDATGSRTLAFGSAYAFGTDITGATLTTTASKRDFIGAIYNATAAKWYIVAFTRGY